MERSGFLGLLARKDTWGGFFLEEVTEECFF